VSRVGAIVARDPAMAGKILQLVNSAFFALPRRVSNPVEAVTLLGLESIGNLALVAGIFHQFDSALYREFQLQGLWQQALVTGVIARAIATDEGFPLVRREAAATAGLLSDLGLLVLVGAQPDLYRAILARMRDRGETPVQAQRQVLGTDQARIGAYLLGVWGLPNEVILAVAYHQDLDAEPGRDLSPACIVHVAHALARDPAASTDDSVGLNLAAFEQRGIAGRLAQWRGCAAAATLPRDKPL
jgi:HD-like signal output (HDOD) protein